MEMHEDEDEPETQDPTVAAFSRLEGEVALMRLAVQQLATEKADIHIPDYSKSLGEISKHLGAAEQTLKVIVSKPAMELTPEDMAQRIDRDRKSTRLNSSH